LRQLHTQASIAAADWLRSNGWPKPEGVADWFGVAEATVVGTLRAPCIAHAMACGVDDAKFGELNAEYTSLGARNLGDGDLVLLASADVHRRYQVAHGVKPRLGPRLEYSENYATRPGGTPRTRLFHPPVGCPLTLHVDPTVHDNLIAALEGLPFAAAVHPLGSTTPRTEPQIDDTGVFGLGPLDENAAWETTLELLADAARDGAAIAVIPELAVGSNVTVQLPKEAPALVLCGSQHRVVDGKKVNQATLHLAGRHVLTHRKIKPFEDLGRPSPSLRESITVGNRLSVLYSDTWSVVVLICADVNDQAVVQLIAEVRVNLILVAAMTPAIGFFDADLTRLVKHAQGLAIWANDPLDPAADVQTSAFFFPWHHEEMSGFKHDRPNVYVHDWRPLPPARTSPAP
jgi:hypothetical protein